MDFSRNSSLPEWDDSRFEPDEDDGDEWKRAAGLAAAKALYNKWREVYALAIVFADTLQAGEDEDDTMGNWGKRLIYENAMIVGAKIMGAVGGDMYILKMENAAIIRTNCKQLIEQVGAAVIFSQADESYEQVIRDAMDEFRALFKEWVATFERDEFEDEWGLFL